MSPDNGQYHLLDENMDADVDHLITHENISIENCAKKCDDNPKCDFFVYLHLERQCDLLEFIRRSYVLQIGLTSDAIFCIKPSKTNMYFS